MKKRVRREMAMLKSVRWWLLIAVVGFAVAACGGDGSPDIFEQSADESGTGATATGSSEPASPADAGAAASGRTAGDGEVPVLTASGILEGADTSGAELSADELVGVAEGYLAFLAGVDTAVLGEEPAGAVLDGLAVPEVVAQIEGWRVENQELATEDLAPLARRSQPSLFAVNGPADAVIVSDCLEVVEEQEFLSLTTYTFVDQLTTLQRSDQGWRVTGFDIRNDGTLFGSGADVGCAPRSYRDRIATAALDLVDALHVGMANPERGVPQPLTALLSDELREQVESSAQKVKDEGTYVWLPVTRDDHEVKVLGSDLMSGNQSFVVGVCTVYREGVESRIRATDEPAPGGQRLPAGTHTYREYGIRLVWNDDATELVEQVYEIRQLESESSCGEGM